MPGKRKKGFKSCFRQDGRVPLMTTTRQTRHRSSQNLYRCSSISESLYSEAVGVFRDSDSDVSEPDSVDSEFDTEAVEREPLEIKPSGNALSEFKESEEESLSRFDESRLLYMSGDKEQIKRLQDDTMQYGLDLWNVESFKDKKENERFYDEMIPEQELEETLKSNVHKYKRCRFNVVNAHDSVCKILDHPDIDGLEEIHISGRSKAGRVFDGDLVLVKIFNYGKYKQNFIGRYQRDVNRNNKLHNVYGKVVGIFESKKTKDIAHPVFVCVLDETSNFLMRPVCKSVPKLNIIHDYHNPNVILVFEYDAQSGSLKSQSRFRIDPRNIKSFTFQVVYIKWTDFHPYPLAAVIKVIKIEENPTSALQNLRLQYHVPKYYGEETVKETERKLQNITLGKVKTEKDREDLTALRVFTIDPSKSLDLDDALSIQTKGENYRIGVHIADVGAAIQKGDAIDLEAQERSCTFYPGQGLKPYHMLPEPFATNICSLLPGVPRPAITIFFTIDKNSFEVKNVEVKKSTVKSLQQFTYEEVQNIIETDSPAGNLDEDILLLFEIAKTLRYIRIKNAIFHFPIEVKLGEEHTSVLKSIEAHYLVEEFMILANRTIAQFLIRTFPDVLPVRCQEAPSQEKVKAWREQNNPILNMVLRLQDVDPSMDQQRIGLEQIQNVIRYIHVMPLQKWVWESLLECARENDMQTAAKLICTDQLHPLQCLALEEWISFQETACYKCTGSVESEKCFHFSLKMKLYVHFTSPIRRYPDLIVNRLIHAALNKAKCPYSTEEVHDLCEGFNSMMGKAKKFQKQCEVLFWGFQLRNTPKMVHAFVKDFTEKSVSIIIPGLRKIPVHCKEIPFNLLHLKEKPSMCRKNDPNDDLLNLKWLQRLYDVTGKPVTRAGWLGKDAKEAFCKRINPHTKAKFVMQETWKTILNVIVEEKFTELQRMLTITRNDDNFGLDEDKHNFVKACKDTVLDHSSEVETGNVIKQGCEYSMSFSRGQIVSVQVSSEPQKGILSPSLQLFDMTRSIKHCLQHTRDPIKFLSKYSILKPQKIYTCTVKYLTVWLPLHEMEAVTSAVDDDSVTINNVQVSFDSKRSGYFHLTKRFCDQRDIDHSRMSELFILQGENENDQQEFHNDNFICLKSEHVCRKPSGSESTVSVDPNDRINWILHGQLTAVERIKSEARKEETEPDHGRKKSTKSRYKLKFKLHDASSDPSDAMLYDENPSNCSVEIIQKSQTDARIEAILKCLGQSTDLAKKIALNKGKYNRLNSWYKKIAQETNVEVNIQGIVGNNEYQKKAIKKALVSPFTLIHGPPGTGKTYTGTKLVYLFDKINLKMQEQGHERMQLVFCGPNNKSVDLVARWMIQKYGKECPDIVRLYGNSLENKDFPTLGKYFSIRGSERDSKPDPKLMDISVHRLIRLEDKPNSEEIRKFDDLFQKYSEGEYEPTLENLKTYRRITSLAAQEELKQHSVIFCTTAVATSPRFIKALTGNIQQLIIDEAGMCTEPESIAAIIATKAQQVVLIGDHKQLRPVLKSTHAAKLGLETSLFERYSDRANMLQIQYRMHPGICEFPSKQFYDGKLQTGSSPKWDIKTPLRIWINRKKIPIVFCHVEGEEEYLAVSTEEGNEQSCSNKKEVDKVVKILKHLIEHESLDLSDYENLNIMSQYNSQCHQIRSAVSDIENVNVNTVVASQGGEWNYVIFSTVRSLPRYRIEKRPTLGWCKKNLGFISDEHQINVALTRARRGLIIIGNKNLLSCDPVWNNLIEHYARLGCVVDENEDFPTASHNLPGGFTYKSDVNQNISPRHKTSKKSTKMVREEKSEDDFYRGTDQEEEMHLRQLREEEMLFASGNI
ncbi:3'-5' exoribonuclease HELZ2-like [Crassostrea virginica]